MSQPNVSFEFFPPKSLAGSFRLWDCMTPLHRTLMALPRRWI